MAITRKRTVLWPWLLTVCFPACGGGRAPALLSTPPAEASRSPVTDHDGGTQHDGGHDGAAVQTPTPAVAAPSLRQIARACGLETVVSVRDVSHVAFSVTRRGLNVAAIRNVPDRGALLRFNDGAKAGLEWPTTGLPPLGTILPHAHGEHSQLPLPVTPDYLYVSQALGESLGEGWVFGERSKHPDETPTRSATAFRYAKDRWVEVSHDLPDDWVYALADRSPDRAIVALAVPTDYASGQKSEPAFPCILHTWDQSGRLTGHAKTDATCAALKPLAFRAFSRDRALGVALDGSGAIVFLDWNGSSLQLRRLRGLPQDLNSHSWVDPILRAQIIDPNHVIVRGQLATCPSEKQRWCMEPKGWVPGEAECDEWECRGYQIRITRRGADYQAVSVTAIDLLTAWRELKGPRADCLAKYDGHVVQIEKRPDKRSFYLIRVQGDGGGFIVATDRPMPPLVEFE